jgi:hypothetical protein
MLMLLLKYLTGKLPVELIERVMDFTEGLMDDEEAQKVRREMMQTREMLQMQLTNSHFCVPFDIWNSPDMIVH